MTPPHSASPDLLEQAHLALLQGNLGAARSLLDQLVMAEPDNVPAQELRATVIARQAGIDETARLQAIDDGSPGRQSSGSSIWTRPIPDPSTALLNSPSVRRWPKPLLLLACLLVGVISMLLPGHRRYNHISWTVEAIIGLAAGAVLFIVISLKKR